MPLGQYLVVTVINTIVTASLLGKIDELFKKFRNLRWYPTTRFVPNLAVSSCLQTKSATPRQKHVNISAIYYLTKTNLSL